MLASLKCLACRKLLALLSLLSLISTFLAPLLVHRFLPFTLGSRVLLSDSLQPLYTVRTERRRREERREEESREEEGEGR